MKKYLYCLTGLILLFATHANAANGSVCVPACDAFGKVISDSNPGYTPFGYAGGIYEYRTDLVRFGARDYFPEAGKWTAEDPIGFFSGGVNYYNYVSNDPVNYIDPTGLSERSAGESQRYDELVKAAQKLYPKKTGKIEQHHPRPQYLGGAKKQKLVPLDGAYHQVITNEFRVIRPYGKGHVNDVIMNNIIKQVYSKYPLPPGFSF